MGKQEVKTSAAGSKRWQWWTESEAQQHLKEWQASGKPLSTFARERGLSASRLAWWKKRLEDGSSPLVSASGSASTLAEARLVPAVVLGLAEERAAAAAAVTVHAPGGVVVEVRDAALVPAEWVAAMVACLRRATP